MGEDSTLNAPQDIPEQSVIHRRKRSVKGRRKAPVEDLLDLLWRPRARADLDGRDQHLCCELDGLQELVRVELMGRRERLALHSESESRSSSIGRKFESALKSLRAAN
eukprot:887869-Rhodomonas_salina.2